MRTLHIVNPNQIGMTKCAKRSRPNNRVLLDVDDSPTRANHYLDEGEKLCIDCCTYQLDYADTLRRLYKSRP